MASAAAKFTALGDPPPRARRLILALQGSIVSVFAFLCFGEFFPQSLTRPIYVFSYAVWGSYEVVLLAALSALVVLLACAGGGDGRFFEPGAGNRPSSATSLLAALNIIPLVAVTATSFW